MQIGAALLSGGQSRRMGRDKSRLLLDGQPFQTRIAAQLDGFPELLLSVGSTLREEPGFRPIPDIFPSCGPLGGLHALLAACRSDALLIVSCDLPLFQRELGLFLAAQLTEAYSAVVPVTWDGRIHPLCGVYRKTLLPEIESRLRAGNRRMVSLLEAVPTRYVPLEGTPFPDRWLTNVNTPQDLRRLLDQR